MRKHSLEPKRMTFICSDTKTPPSMVLIEAKKGASASLTLTKSIYIYKDTEKSLRKVMSDEALAIYENCSLD
jgi:tRNA1(Val) A37 N6-methylase TrmN6